MFYHCLCIFMYWCMDLFSCTDASV